MDHIESPDNPRDEAKSSAAKAAISIIPYVNGAILEAFKRFDPVEKRQLRWRDEVTEAINRILNDFQRPIEDLAQDQAFVSSLMTATEIAVRNHQEEKIGALRNALVSCASPSYSDYDFNARMLLLIDELGVADVALLHAIQLHELALSKLKNLDLVFAKLCEVSDQQLDRYTFRAIFQDLQSKFLVSLGDVEDIDEFRSKQVSLVTEESGVRPVTITDLGIKFLRFIQVDQLS